MGENPYNEILKMGESKEKTNVATTDAKFEGINFGEISGNSEGINSELGTSFKVAKTNLPEKTGMWTKIKNALFYEVKVELTPYQQKVEDEINEFLYQEVTWQSFKNFLFQEVPITYKGKRIF